MDKCYEYEPESLFRHSDGFCQVPPPGWSCTREPGHDGPCAAWPINDEECVWCGKGPKDHSRFSVFMNSWFTSGKAPSLFKRVKLAWCWYRTKITS